ncbi:MAG: hypothetical protein ACRDJM_00590, partial [Actinomycetota bacterium]
SGTRARTARLYSLHVLGAAMGGAATGVALGGLGDAAGLDGAPLPVVGLAAALATYLGAREKGKLGRQCQVPRIWARSSRQNLVALGWGAMLGCGVATLIPHSAFFLLAGTQLVAGPALGAASGAVFGAVRQATILHPTMRSSDPQTVMSVLPRLRRRVARLNTAVAFAGGVALLLAAWRSL